MLEEVEIRIREVWRKEGREDIILMGTIASFDDKMTFNYNRLYLSQQGWTLIENDNGDNSVDKFV